MSISSNAAESEQNSRFYKANSAFCEEFEKFILDKGGKVTGSFNSWSYEVYGKIRTPQQWVLKYKKSTLSSGNIFFSSKYQNLFVSLEWSTLIKTEQKLDFLIRKRKLINFRQLPYDQTSILTDISNKYVIYSESSDSTLISELTNALKEQFKTNQIYKIQLINNQLKIEMRTDQHYFEIFQKLVDHFTK
jgi:hypothetical protein